MKNTPNLKAYEIDDFHSAFVFAPSRAEAIRKSGADDWQIERRPDLDQFAGLGYVPAEHLIFHAGYHCECDGCGKWMCSKPPTHPSEKHLVMDKGQAISAGIRDFCSKTCQEKWTTSRPRIVVVA